MDDRPAISFVIPAHNEQQCLPKSLLCIHKHTPPDLSYEVIVVDHASTDATAQIARETGAKVVKRTGGGNIAAVRNCGVAQSHGSVVVFLDADVRLTPEWGSRIGGVLEELGRKPGLVTGSFCDVPEEAGWLQKSWFGPRAIEPHPAYLGTGHLILTRTTFDRVGGFNEKLETGEDYEFCARARARGCTIVHDSSLRVIHDGYPDTAISFFRREMWHGRGDVASLTSVARSRVALAALGCLGLHLTAGIALVFGYWDTALGSVDAILLLCLLASAHRFRRTGWRRMLANLPVAYLYLTARAAAFAYLLGGPRSGNRVARRREKVGDA